MIQCTEIYNNSCLRCSALNMKMVRIGAFIFCYPCWMHIFKGAPRIGPESKYHERYLAWVKTYKQKEKGEL